MSLPYFNLYVDDYEADTVHLTVEEDGVYNRLLRLCWRSPGCAVPDDRKWLMRRLRVDADTFDRAVVPVIEEFFSSASGMISNQRLVKEFLGAKEKHEKRVSAGKSGGKAKSLKTNNPAPSNATAMPEQCSSNQNQNQNQNHKEEDRDFVPVQSAIAPTPASEVAEAVSAYNRTAKAIGWPQVQKMTPARTKAVRGRLSDAGGIDGWSHAINRAAASDFLSGRDGRWNAFGFDWVTKSANFTKLMEGNYDNRDNPRGQQFGGHGSGNRKPGQGTAEAFAVVGARLQQEQGGG